MNLNAANVSRLIWYMEGLNDPRFTMRVFFHGCGAPACALGHAAVLFGVSEKQCYGDFAERTFGDYLSLFSNRLSFTITTPQQWAAHARRVMAEAGLEVVPNEGSVAQSGLLRLPVTEEIAGSNPAGAANAAPGFAAFMERVLNHNVTLTD